MGLFGLIVRLIGLSFLRCWLRLLGLIGIFLYPQVFQMLRIMIGFFLMLRRLSIMGGLMVIRMVVFGLGGKLIGRRLLRFW